MTTAAAFVSPNGKPLTAGYRPSVYRTLRYRPDHPRGFTILDVERMRWDPRVSFGLRILRAPLSQIKWEVKSANPEAGKWVDRTLRKLWSDHLTALAQSMLWGHAGGEPLWEVDEKTDLIELKGLREVHPLDMIPMVTSAGFWGVRVRGGHSKHAHLDLPSPRCLWVTHEPEYGGYYGTSRLASAWEPWSEKANRHGAKDSRRQWYLTCAFNGGAIRHPMGSFTESDGSIKSYQALAEEILEKKMNGGVLAMPNTRDENGNYLWEYIPPEINGNGMDIRDYPKDLDDEIFQGMNIPKEVVEAAETGSGWAGRTVPFLVFLTSEDGIAQGWITSIDRQLLRPGTEANFGPGTDYAIVVKSLVPPPEDQPGGGGGGGGPGGPKVPGQPYRGPKGGQGVVGNDGKVHYGAARLGLMGGEWHGPEPPGEGWQLAGEGPHGGKIWRRTGGQAASPEEPKGRVARMVAAITGPLAQLVPAPVKNAVARIKGAVVERMKKRYGEKATAIILKAAVYSGAVPIVGTQPATLAVAFIAAETARMIGLIGNTPPVQLALGGSLTFEQIVEAVREFYAEFFAEMGEKPPELDEDEIGESVREALDEEDDGDGDDMVQLGWTAFTTKRGSTAAVNEQGRKVYGKEAERVLSGGGRGARDEERAGKKRAAEEARAEKARAREEAREARQKAAEEAKAEKARQKEEAKRAKEAAKPTVESVTKSLKETLEKPTREGVLGMLTGLMGLKLTEMRQVVANVGGDAKARSKSELGKKIAEIVEGKKEVEGGRDRTGSAGGGEKAKEAGRPVAGAAVQPAPTTADQGGKDAGKPAGAKAAQRVPASQQEVNKRLDRYEQFFRAKGQHEVADWMGMIRSHVNEVGTDAALASLGEEVAGQGEEVYYEGAFAGMPEFAAAYLNRHGITPTFQLGEEGPAGTVRRISAQIAPETEGKGAGDFRPLPPALDDKLKESQALPGLEKSEDINKIMGREVSHLTPEVTAKMDEVYGKGGWIIKPYGSEGYAGHGIYFPQRVAQIQREAQSTLWDSGSHLAQYGFSHLRNKQGEVIGIRHQNGDEYQFGTDAYENTIQGDARHWADQAAAAAAHEKGAALMDREGRVGSGAYMVQPAFAAVGVSDADRAAGRTIAPGEGRVHIVTRNGKAELVPHSTWIKGEHLPVVFESEETKAMAKAAMDAINALPEAARRDQIYAPDVIKTADGYKVVEANPSDPETGSSGYLEDNPMIIDAYVSHLTGRTPAHVNFIRKLLSVKDKSAPKDKPAKGGKDAVKAHIEAEVAKLDTSGSGAGATDYLKITDIMKATGADAKTVHDAMNDLRVEGKVSFASQTDRAELSDEEIETERPGIGGGSEAYHGVRPHDPTQKDPEFTGTDPLGRQWRGGKLVRPAKRKR